jgi:hypothetical protein
MSDNSNYPKVSICGLGFALGVANGLGMMCMAWLAMCWGFGMPMITLVGSVYHGYGATLIGGLYGAGWGFLDGFVFGIITAFFYNLCLCCCCKKKS